MLKVEVRKCVKGELRVGINFMIIKKIVLADGDSLSCFLKYGQDFIIQR